MKSESKKKEKEISTTGRSLWEVLVIFASFNFYILCLVGVSTSFILSLYVLAEAGEDVSFLAHSMKAALWLGLAYVAIIMLDKILGRGK